MRALAFIAMIGCTGGANYWIDYRPLSGSSTKPRSDVVQKSVIAITDAGREIESSDATSGIVLSRWFGGDGFAPDDTRFRIRVSVSDTGSYDIASLCQRKSAMTSAWEDGCDPAKRPRFVVETIAKIEQALR